jgi:two-component system sensor histidine kinase BaeS
VTENAPTAARSRSLATRIALAFAGVALAAVGLVVLMVIVSTSRETTSLAASQRQAAADSAARSAAQAYDRAGGWVRADTADALRTAREAGGGLTILDAQGAVVASGGGGRGGGQGPGPGAGQAAQTSTARIVSGGRSVGSVVFRVPGSGLSAAERRLRDRLVRIALVSGLVAVLLALVAGFAVARRLTAPLRRLTRAAGALEHGDVQARAAAGTAPGEIGELAQAFDGMAQALDDQEQARTALLAEIAHELRTPLTILRGNCEALVDGVMQPTADRLASLHDEVLRLEGLVADLETLSASESATLRLDRAPVDLAVVAGDALSLIAGRADGAGITLASDLAPVVVPADRDRLAQIVENLLSNALKFTPSGGTVSVRVAPVDEGAVIEVRDTGRGIPADELPHVFERHWRGRGAGDVGGRGIGLAVVSELVRAHRGSVVASSEPGNGSRFTVTLPAD